MSDQKTLLQIVGGVKIYQTRNIRTFALNGVHLSVQPAEFLAISGDSGSGKSTLLSVAGFVEHLDQGQIVFAGEDVTRASKSRQLQLRRDDVSYVFQSFNLVGRMTVKQNVELRLKHRGLSRRERRTRVDAILERFNLLHRRDHFPDQLSGGQQQRVALARAMVLPPKLLLADEPTGNLDSGNRRIVLDLIEDFIHEGVAVVVATHSQEVAGFASRKLVMADGRIEV